MPSQSFELELARERERMKVLTAKQAAEFWGVSYKTWQRLYRAEKVPAPFKISDRLYGWRRGDLEDAINARAA